MKYKCTICGRIHDEEETGIALQSLKHCPLCEQPISKFVVIEEESEAENFDEDETDLSYPSQFARSDESIRHMDTIHQIAVSGEEIVSAMATSMPMPNWDDILILGSQLNPMPIERDIDINTQTVIGKNAKKPMVIETPIIISHMSYGALSKEIKTALAQGSAAVKTAIGSGEGGILPEEYDNAYKYIFEYVPNKYSVNEENLKKVDAIEIKIGQSTKPGLGGQIPGSKVTKEIAEIRDKLPGETIHSPAKFKEINSKDDLKDLVDKLREKSDGRPIGVKIAAGRIEDDLEYVLYSGADFVTIDGRGGATGASPYLVRESTSVPTIYALSRARKYLDEHNSDISLIITGGLRVSSDFAKAIAMGADAVAIGSAALIAAACQQYKICGTGECPVGIATQSENLRDRFDFNPAVLRISNFLNQSTEDLKTFSRITSHLDVHDMNVDDLTTFESEISNYTDIKHV